MTADDDAPAEQQEGLEDLGESGHRYEAVINQADWTVETTIQQINKGNIELNPDFQRREAWRTPRKSQYIESLIINVPVPQIVLAERRDKRGTFIVIDGKQRLLTLRQFYAHPKDKTYKAFKLSDLSIRTDLNGLRIGDLADSTDHEADYNSLANSTIRTAVIRNWDDENFLYTVFLRLNTGSVPLSPQELRQALHPGEFVRFVDNYSSKNAALHSVLGVSGADPRMRDAELVIRFFAFRNFLSTYTGNLKPLLDDTANHFNKHWTSEHAQIEAQRREFEEGIATTSNLFPDKAAFRKWNGFSYEKSLNRAVFDAMMYYFAFEPVRASARQIPAEVVAAFKRKCLEDNFKASIEGTTKSIDAIYTRLREWGEALRDLGIPVNLPRLIENKIVRDV